MVGVAGGMRRCPLPWCAFVMNSKCALTTACRSEQRTASDDHSRNATDEGARDKPKRRYVCGKCDVVLDNDGDLVLHWTSVHNVPLAHAAQMAGAQDAAASTPASEVSRKASSMLRHRPGELSRSGTFHYCGFCPMRGSLTKVLDHWVDSHGMSEAEAQALMATWNYTFFRKKTFKQIARQPSNAADVDHNGHQHGTKPQTVDREFDEGFAKSFAQWTTGPMATGEAKAMHAAPSRPHERPAYALGGLAPRTTPVHRRTSHGEEAAWLPNRGVGHTPPTADTAARSRPTTGPSATQREQTFVAQGVHFDPLPSSHITPREAAMVPPERTADETLADPDYADAEILATAVSRGALRVANTRMPMSVKDGRQWLYTSTCHMPWAGKAHDASFTSHDPHAATSRAVLRVCRLGFDLPQASPPHVGLLARTTIADDLVDLLVYVLLKRGHMPALTWELDAAAFAMGPGGHVAVLHLGQPIGVSPQPKPPLNLLGALNAALCSACTSQLIAAGRTSAQATQLVQRVLDAKIQLGAGSNPEAALTHLLVRSLGHGFTVRQEPAQGEVQATVVFAGAVRGAGELVVLGRGVGATAKVARREAVLDALRCTAPKAYELLRHVPSFAAETAEMSFLGNAVIPTRPARKVACVPAAVRRADAPNPPTDAALTEAARMEGLLRDCIAKQHGLALRVEQHAQPAVEEGGEPLWQTAVSSVDDDGTATELSNAAHTDKEQSALLACSRALEYFYPEAREASFVQQKDAAASAVGNILNPSPSSAPLANSAHETASREPLPAAAVPAPIPARSELAQMRHAVSAAVAQVAGDNTAVAEAVQALPGSAGHRATLSVEGRVLAAVTAPSALLALHAAYRALAASPLLDDSPPPLYALEASTGDVTHDTVSTLETICAERRSTPRDALKAVATLPQPDPGRPEATVSTWAQRRYGVALHVVARPSEGGGVTATAYVASPGRDKTLRELLHETASTHKGAISAALEQVVRTHFPDRQAEFTRCTAQHVRLEPACQQNGNATVDAALRRLLAVGANDIDTVLELRAGALCVASVIQRSSGTVLGTASDEAVLVALRGAHDAALARAGTPAAAAEGAQRVRKAATALGRVTPTIAAGPVLFATFLTARHHGLRLAFRVAMEQLATQVVWVAEAVLCARSADLDPLLPPAVRELQDDEGDAPALSPLVSGAVLRAADAVPIETGAAAVGSSKRAAMGKAAARFLRAQFPAEYEAARALSGAYEVPASSQNELAELDSLRAQRDRRRQERVSGLVRRRLRIEARAQEAAGELLEETTSATAVQKREDSAAAQPILPSSAETTDTTSPAASTRQDHPLLRLLMEVHRREAGHALRVDVEAVAGGWLGRALEVPEEAGAGAARELTREPGSSAAEALGKTCYITLQRLYPGELMAAATEHDGVAASVFGKIA
jgi:hypothetical protein